MSIQSFGILVLTSIIFPTISFGQCPTSLTNDNGNGNLTLFFNEGETPDNLTSVDIDFTTIDGNYSVTQIFDNYQTDDTGFAGQNLTGDLVMNFSDNSTLDCNYIDGQFNDPLPVELTEFRGQLRDENILLYWSTSSEENNWGFEIERSFDGQNFSIVGMINGNGNSIINQDYNFLDIGVKLKALSETVYYKLVQIDFDGQKTYSEAIVIDLGFDFKKFEITKITGWDSTERTLQVYFYNPHDIQKLIFIVTDINGRTLEKRSIYPDFGLNNFEVDLSSHRSPFYFLSLNNGKSIIVEKVALSSDY